MDKRQRGRESEGEGAQKDDKDKAKAGKTSQKWKKYADMRAKCLHVFAK